jgi:hypothetical protein
VLDTDQGVPEVRRLAFSLVDVVETDLLTFENSNTAFRPTVTIFDA